MKRLFLASLIAIVFTNLASASEATAIYANLNVDCAPEEIGDERTPDGKLPMVFHLVLGSATVDGLKLSWESGNEVADDFFLPAEESDSTMALEINFSTPIGGPGQSAAVPVQVYVKNKDLVLGEADKGDAALLPLSSIKAALLEGSKASFNATFVEKKESMKFTCEIK